jgi:hypothetical protein
LFNGLNSCLDNWGLGNLTDWGKGIGSWGNSDGGSDWGSGIGKRSGNWCSCIGKRGSCVGKGSSGIAEWETSVSSWEDCCLCNDHQNGKNNLENKICIVIGGQIWKFLSDNFDLQKQF